MLAKSTGDSESARRKWHPSMKALSWYHVSIGKASIANSDTEMAPGDLIADSS